MEKDVIEKIFESERGNQNYSLAIQNGAGYIGKTRNILQNKNFLENYMLCKNIVLNLKSTANILEYIPPKLDKGSFCLILENLNVFYRDILMLKLGQENLVEDVYQKNELNSVKDEYSITALKNILKNLDDTDKKVISKIQKAMAVIQFKVEGKIIKRHPEYEMDDRLFLDKIDYENGKVRIGTSAYDMNDKNFPTINRDNPYELTDEERELMERLRESFLNSETLKKHITFLYSKGSMYKVFNSNLLFHGCVPMNEDGSFLAVNIMGKTLAGKEYFDFLDKTARKAFTEREENLKNDKD